MNTTKNFKNTIQAYLERRAFGDELFAQAYKKPDKNIDDCVTYILNQVKESGCNGFADAEIYNLATHYYMEDEIEIGKKVKCEVVVNHKVELTEEDRKEAKAKAMAELVEEEKKRMTKKVTPTALKEDAKIQTSNSLF